MGYNQNRETEGMKSSIIDCSKASLIVAVGDI